MPHLPDHLHRLRGRGSGRTRERGEPAGGRAAAAARRRPAAPPPDEDEGYEEERPSRTSARRRRSLEEEDYEEDEDDEEERPRRRKRRRRRTADAEAAVAAPAIILLITGILGVLMWVVNLLFLAMNPNQNPLGGPAAANDAGFRVGQVVGVVVSLLWCIIVIVGAIQMKRLQGYGAAMTAAIAAMLPCNLCCLLGLPIGIWALVVLAREDVKQAFS